MVSRVLMMYLLWAMIVYCLAVAGLWWASLRIIEHTLRKEAVQWVTEIDSMSTPVFVSKKGAHLSQLDHRLRNFPEIAYVRFYTTDGKVLDEYRSTPQADLPSISADQISRLEARAGADQPYMFDTSVSDLLYVRLLSPVIIKSVRSDSLFNLDLDKTQKEKIRTIGYIDLGMDTGYYREHLIRAMLIGSLVVAVMIIASLIFGRYFIRRALMPLTMLEQPLARLARGDTDVVVDNSTGDSEILAISNALNTTISALKERDRSLREMADHDSLTGLVNRGYFIRQVEKEIPDVVRRGGSSAILFVDLDQFKYVNDTLGHAAGDRLLVQVTALLKGRMRENDIISRFGGDEFTILARNVARNGALEIARTINEMMRNFHFTESGSSFNILCSIGITMVESDAFHTEDLIAQADMACHEAKRRGRNRFHMHEIADRDKLRMEADVSWSRLIKRALREDLFTLYYQPMVRLSGNGGELYEVLLRMPGANGQLELPGAFLPSAERFGLMLETDRWVIAHAIGALAQFRTAGRDITFSINLSAQSFEDSSLLEIVRENLVRHDVPPGALIFEITEQMAVRSLDKTREIIQSLLDLGCRFALDDFGAGFSSLSYLKHLPTDFVKISQTFVENIAHDEVDQTMVRAIIQIAKSLGRLTVAEYVQDIRSIELLREYGVDYAQGNYIAMPSAILDPRVFLFHSQKKPVDLRASKS